MEVKTFLQNSLNTLLEAEPDLFQVGTEHKESSSKFVFVIDGDNGFDIKRCEKLSRSLLNLIHENAEMEEKRDNFSFEISSPGAEQPIVMPRQYKKHEGREIQLVLQDDSKFNAKILEVAEDGLKLMTLIKSKVKGRLDKEGEERFVPFEKIKENKIILSFK